MVGNAAEETRDHCCGDRDGYGDGDSYGDDYGDGYGYGDGDGYGYGYGYDYGYDHCDGVGPNDGCSGQRSGAQLQAGTAGWVGVVGG